MITFSQLFDVDKGTPIQCQFIIVDTCMRIFLLFHPLQYKNIDKILINSFAFILREGKVLKGWIAYMQCSSN
jgi:hypothetical protein